MLKKINALIFLTILFGTGKVFAQFPYYESFKNATAPNVIIPAALDNKAYLTSGKSDPATGILDPVGQGYLRLTGNRGDEKGFVHSEKSFSSAYGLKIEFEYFTYGGTLVNRGSADGITFFLYDAAVKDNEFRIGGFGGSLGYAQYKKATDPTATDGVTGGYLGIGLDEYGNFANPTEERSDGPGPKKSSVTLRGRGTGNVQKLPNSLINNYRYLEHRQTIDNPIPDQRFDIVGGCYENPNTGTKYNRYDNSTQRGYRKVLIDLDPADGPNQTGYFITVKIVTGDTDATGAANPTTHLLIDKYHYPDLAPAQLKYGIASSTGFETNYHEIRNLRINTFDPIPPVAANDAFEVAKNTPLGLNILENDTDLNGNHTIAPSTIVITDFPDHGTHTINTTTGIVTYTPTRGYLGSDSFKYRVKDEDGALSNEATVTLDIQARKPVGQPDTDKTLVNKPVTIDVLKNDPSFVDVTVIPGPTSQPGASVIVNADGTVKYTPPTGVWGNDSFSYTLRNVDGLVSDPILVSIVIQSPPKAEDDQVSTPMDESVNINLISKNKDNDGTIIKAKIVVDPKFGKLSLPDALGNVIYTPDPSFVGSDTFQYTVQDNDGLISSPGTVTINVTSVPKIGLSKALTSVRNSINGSFVVRFNFTIGNYGKELLEKISLKDNLALSFAGTQVKVLAINPTGTLKANSNYNGVGDIEMLSPTSTLATGKIETVELILSIMLSDAEGFFQNTAIVEGYSVLSGTKTDDASVSGVRPDPFTPGNVTPLGPTVVELKKGPLYIPEGFSPNNDGINDVFIVSNSQGKKIHLDVYNRWGNRVYKSSSYQNDWDGRCSEGIYLGQDLPAGTYYYIVIIDDKEKFMGYITINR